MIKPYYENKHGVIYHGNCIDILPEISGISCCVTSPPYWGLRDYGTAEWEGGDINCDHIKEQGSTRGGPKPTITGGQDTTPHIGQYMTICDKCGAQRIDKQIGVEETPEQYTQNMVEIFRLVKNAMNKDATLWLNLGDSYNGSGGDHKEGGKNDTGFQGNLFRGTQKRNIIALKPKDLVGIPWRVVFALQSDGWWLRQDIIWHKPNPMPESVTDRCTKSHEYIFLLSKSAKYYYDADAIKEKSVKAGQIIHKYNSGAKDRQDISEANDRRTRIGLANWDKECPDVRNKRSVWTVTTKPYKEAHFATYPPDLIEPCIKAGCPDGGIVLDPFLGSGTTGVVAGMNGKKFIGIELNEEYCEIAVKRIEQSRTGLTKAELEAGQGMLFE